MPAVPVEMCETQQGFAHFHQAAPFFLFCFFFLSSITFRPATRKDCALGSFIGHERDAG
jgi:hypothetical protein